MIEPLVVIGIGHDGPEGLAPESRAHLAAAEVLAGGKRHLAHFPEFTGQKIVIAADIAAVIEQLKACRAQKTVVLASGDPLFYGIGAALRAALPKDELIFLPQVSSVQLAFARLKESWHDARVVSVHGRPIDILLPALEERASKIAILTDARNDPSAIGALLQQHGMADDYDIWVCEELGSTAERVTSWTADSVAGQQFAPLNVVVLLRRAIADIQKVPTKPSPLMGEGGSRSEPGEGFQIQASPHPAFGHLLPEGEGHDLSAGSVPGARASLPLLGIPDLQIAHHSQRRGMITKREVRLISLAYLQLRPDDTLWDIGAGSGSVSIEAARLSNQLKVFAIEQSAAAVEQIHENIRNFKVSHVDTVHGSAPEVLFGLPNPDAVFVGGSGGRLEEILSQAVAQLRPGGRLVMNCITLENFQRGWSLLDRLGLAPQVTSVQLAHSKPLGSLHAMEPDSPIFILHGCKR